MDAKYGVVILDARKTYARLLQLDADEAGLQLHGQEVVAYLACKSALLVSECSWLFSSFFPAFWVN